MGNKIRDGEISNVRADSYAQLCVRLRSDGIVMWLMFSRSFVKFRVVLVYRKVYNSGGTFLRVYL